jgi:hypothetical protein
LTCGSQSQADEKAGRGDTGPGHDVSLGLRCGEHHHGDGVQVGVGLEFAENPQAAAAGQVEVEHDQSGPGHVSEVIGAAQEPHRLLTVADDVQLQAQVMVLEGVPGQQHVSEVVLDQENIGGAEQG